MHSNRNPRAHARSTILALAATAFSVAIGAAALAQAPAASSAGSPAPAAAQNTAPPANQEQIDAGRARFAAQCGFCHGRDAAGGETGPDLTHSALVASDVGGEKISAMIRTGRPDKGMPPQTLPDADVAAIVAFLHDAHAKAASQNGGRRRVSADDLQTGNAQAGRDYFFGPGKCSTCHQISGSFATVGSRYEGLPLLLRMLYPRSGRFGGGGAPVAPPTATVTTASGQRVTGALAFRDEFTVGITDADGWLHTFPADGVRLTVDDPLQAHADQLAKYTDDDIHNVLAFLQTLR